MSKDQLPLVVGDISGFARALRKQLDGLAHMPGHVEMLNLLVKSAGYKNFQHYRAETDAACAPDPHGCMETVPESGAHVLPEAVQSHASRSAEETTERNGKRIQQVARYFDEDRRLVRWPKKFSQRMICLWVMWARIPARATYTEREISDWLETQHLFGDHALLRRELVDRGLVTRTADGSQYRRLEQQPPAEALAVFERLRA